MLKLTGICHSYGKQAVLKDVSLTLRPRQRIALMGPSGVGKTTLLRVALGLLRPQKGKVENRFQKTAAVFQEPRLLNWRTAAENVNLVLGDKAGTLPKAHGVLTSLGLGDAADKYPGELSGGMQQRVAIARALAVEADLLILDEPFKAMDVSLRREVMARVARTNAAIVLVTHDREEAACLGCEIVQMR